MSLRRPFRQFIFFVILPLLIAGGGTIWLTVDLVSRLSTGANVEDHKRTAEIIQSALGASQQQLADTMADNANWDDAAVNIYAAEIDEAFVIPTWGDSSGTGVNYDLIFAVDHQGQRLTAYVKGENAALDTNDYFGGQLLPMLRRLPQNQTDFRSIAGIIKTADGLAIVAAGNLVPTTPDIKLETDQPRFLVFAKFLTPEFIRSLGGKFVVNGLRLVESDKAGEDGVVITDSAGVTLGALQWLDRRPGDLSRNAVLPVATIMLTVLITVMTTIALFSWHQFQALAKRERQANNDARQDALTGLPNRQAVNEKLADLLNAGAGDVCVAFIDLDGFKEVNDTYDHDTGDRLIKSVAAGITVLAEGCSLFGRIGGDEFVILSAGADASANAGVLAEKVISFLKAPFDIDGRIATVGASIGIASSGVALVTAPELMRRADVAMYKAKASGKNRTCIFDGAMDESRDETAAIAAELRTILDHGQISCVFQPIIDAATLGIVGVEALARWPETSARRIGPDRFIPIAETAGLISKLGEAILETACRAALNWPGLRVSVNVSPVQLRDPDFAAIALAIIDRTGIARDRVELEVTEGTVIDDIHRLRPIFEKLHLAGVSVALDDFGSGYSSIAYLRELAFDRIKIDRSLIMTMLTSESARTMIQATGLIANGVNAAVTAEGVESGDVLQMLRLAGCSEFQGYYFGKPQSAAAISEALSAPRNMAAA